MAGRESEWFDSVDNGSGLTFDDFSAAAAGQNEWVGIDDPRLPPDDQNQDILFTAGTAGVDNVNTSSTGLGVNSQGTNVNELLRVDYVTDINIATGDTHDISTLTYDTHYSVSQGSFEIVQVNPATVGNMVDVLVTAYDANNDLNFGNDPTDVILSVTILDELGADVTVILPPFYYKDVAGRGLLDYYRRLFAEAVPDDGLVMVYHIPQVTQVPISFNLLEDLVSVSDGRLVGVKDSSGDPEHAKELCRRFPDMNVFVGSDRLLLAGLELGADGCITAGANVLGPLAVDVYRAYATGDPADPLQGRLTAARLVFERYQPFPAALKSLLALRYGGDWNGNRSITDQDFDDLVHFELRGTP